MTDTEIPLGLRLTATYFGLSGIIGLLAFLKVNTALFEIGRLGAALFVATPILSVLAIRVSLGILELKERDLYTGIVLAWIGVITSGYNIIYFRSPAVVGIAFNIAALTYLNAHKKLFK